MPVKLAGVMGAEAIRILLARGRMRASAVLPQFDPFVGKLVSRESIRGNRSLSKNQTAVYPKAAFSKGANENSDVLFFGEANSF